MNAETSIGTELAQIAEHLTRYFEYRERHRIGDHDPSRYVTLKDDAPARARDLAQAAHGLDEHGAPAMLPDDYRYQWTLDALHLIADEAHGLSDEGLQDLADEFSDCADVYTSDLTAWLSSHAFRPGYCDEACDDLDGFDPGAGILARIAAGQGAERREVFGLVLDFLRTELGA